VVTLARRDGGADGEVGRDVVARREGEGRARRGRQEGPNGKGGWPDRGRGGLPDGMDGDLWGPDRIGRCPNGKDVGDGRGGCQNKGEG
jgi:hypothetical protein